MTLTEPPDWFLALQGNFGEALLKTTSLADLTSGDSDVAPDLLSELSDGPRRSARACLAIYQRQYWFRLFSALHQALPLVTWLMSPRVLNEHALRILSADPPRGRDLEDVVRTFAKHLTQFLETNAAPLRAPALESSAHLPVQLLREALDFDSSCRSLLMAPQSDAVNWDSIAPERLANAQLRLLPTVCVKTYSFQLQAMRAQALRSVSQEHATAPSAELLAASAPQHWLIMRQAQRLSHLPLSSFEHMLIRLLNEMPLPAALRQLEQDWARESAQIQSAQLKPQAVQDFLARTRRLEIWTLV